MKHILSPQRILAVCVLAVGLTTAHADGSPKPLHFLGLGSFEIATLSPDGKYLATAGRLGVIVWDIALTKVVKAFPWPADLIPQPSLSSMGAQVVFSDDGRIIAASSYHEGAAVWNFASESLIYSKETSKDVGSIELSPDGMALFLAECREGSPDRAVMLRIDVATGDAVELFTAKVNCIPGMELSPDGKILAIALARSGVVELRNPADGSLLHTLGGGIIHEEYASGATWSDNGRFILTTGTYTNQHRIGAEAKVWDAETLDLVQTLRPDAETISTARFSPDGGKLLLAGLYLPLSIWNVSSAEKVVEMPLPNDLGWQGYSWAYISAAFLSGSGNIITAIPRSRVEIWESDFSSRISQHWGAGPGSPLCFSPDGSIAYTLHGQMTYAWDVQDGALLNAYEPGDFPTNICPSPPLTVTLSASSARISDTKTGAIVTELDTTGFEIETFAFSPDFKQLLMGGMTRDGVGTPRRTAKLWKIGVDVPQWESVSEEEGTMTAVGFSPDGGSFAIAGSYPFCADSCVFLRSSIEIWNVSPFERIQTIKKDDINSVDGLPYHQSLSYPLPYAFVAFPWNRDLLFANHQIYDAQSGKLLSILPLYNWWTSVFGQLSPDGTLLLTEGPILWRTEDLLPIGLQIISAPGGTQLKWHRGDLQHAPALHGPWTDLPAASPLKLSPIGEKGFFRVKVQE